MTMTKPPSWRTTTLGILTILGTLTGAGISILNGGHLDMSTLSAGLTAGVGLIMAGDHANQ